jgi:CopG family nickel-responsive transcriptional regulator
MQRITITVDDDLLQQVDALARARGYSNRSEAFRDILRDRLERERFETVAAPTCVGCLTYVYDHSAYELPRRLVQDQHAHHDVSLATLHVHLDHENCLEAVILRGPTEHVTGFAQATIARRGIRHGQLWLVPVDVQVASHAHEDHAHPAATPAPAVPHVHSRPKT